MPRNFDLLGLWEAYMADISQSLLIKYGLANRPSQGQTQEWALLARQYAREGANSEVAGERAAQALFRDYRTRHYASQADTIEMLLREIDKK
jgi:hypothetical protein